MSGVWVRVSKQSACPICGSDSWCQVSEDGAVAMCMRQADGAYLTKDDSTGATAYFHRVGGEPVFKTIQPQAKSSEAPRGDGLLLNAVYTALLAELSLSADHIEAMTHRGFSEAAVARFGYRTLPVRGRHVVVQKLEGRFGKELLNVPGFATKVDKGTARIVLKGPAGILVPVRTASGAVIALKVRLDEPKDGPRYIYLSSKSHGGPGPGAPVHVPLHATDVSTTTLRLTEGEIKSDLATELSGVLTIAAPGVGSWRPALDVAVDLGCRRLLLAFDADAETNQTVARCLKACLEEARHRGLDVVIERWEAAAGKGIDDVLAAGGDIKTIEADDATDGMAVLAVSAVDSEVGGSGVRERILELLRTEGAAALFRRDDLLGELADLALEDKNEFMAVVEEMKACGVGINGLKKMLQPFIASRRRERPTAKVESRARYVISGGAICKVKQVDDETVELPLCNFTATIIEEIRTDDGVESQTSLVIEGRLDSGRLLARTEVAGTNYSGMLWVVASWGASAIIFAGQAIKDQLREAIQSLSTDAVRRTIYTHTGWTIVDGEWFYLSGIGAIGANGLREDIEVRLQGALDRFRLPAPVDAEDRRRAIRASLGLLNGLAPDSITFPLFAATYRAVLGPCDMSLHITGKTGVFKSETAVLFQRHFGPTFDRKNLPATWQSTGNALEMAAFSMKDALMVIDEFVPSGTSVDRQRLQATAERVLRAQGNGSGRQRCNAKGELKVAKPPRGLILSCGEESPRGQSLQARTQMLELKDGDVNIERLTECQRLSGEGAYALAMSCFVQWLAPRMPDISKSLDARIEELRTSRIGQGGHRRTPTNISNLLLGLAYFLDFAVGEGAITEEERRALLERADIAFNVAVEAQAMEVQDSDPTTQFLRLVASAIVSGKAHLEPVNFHLQRDDLVVWGWRVDPSTNDGPRPQGTSIGWIDGEDVYLDPDAVYAAAQQLARDQGETLAVAQKTLHSRLRDQGHLASIDKGRNRIVVRRMLLGVERKVLHLAAPTLVKRNGQNGHSTKTSEQADGEEAAIDPPVTASLAQTVATNGQRSIAPEHDLEPNGRSGRFEITANERCEEKNANEDDASEWEAL